MTSPVPVEDEEEFPSGFGTEGRVHAVSAKHVENRITRRNMCILYLKAA